MIRNLNKLGNHTEFFELIGKTKSSVICTADGLVINDKIDIAREAYNDIGKAMFTEKLNQIGKARDGFLHEKVMEEFGKDISPDKREEFEAKLKNIENLPREKQKELAKKQLHGIITPEEQEKLQKQLAKCSSHRKEYFVKYLDSIFKTENIIGASHVQGGGIKQSYATSFDTRIHAAFTHGENRTIATHFLKDL